MLESKKPFQARSTLGAEVVGELHATLENERFVGVGTSTSGRVVLRALLADELDPLEYRACHWGYPAFGEVAA